VDNEFADNWPRIQRGIELISLSMPYQFLPLRLIRRLTHGLVAYQPGVYIFTYHTIIDPENAEKWEIAYDKGWVSRTNFEKQVAYLCRKMIPISLSKAFKLLASGTLDQPYFVLTFDDGYSDVLKNAAPIVARFGVKPCMFVNGRMAQGHAYYRILSALLTKSGHTVALQNQLKSRDCGTPWSSEPLELFNQTKNFYRPGIIEDSVEAAYTKCLGEPAELGVHLNPEEVRQLQADGWEFGNHTFDHRLLSRLDAQQIAETMYKNEIFWREENVPLINALAIPNGALKDVNEHLHPWLQEHKSMHALFCNGGVNFKYDRTQCLRFFGGNGDELLLHEIICAEIERTNRLWKKLEVKG